MKWINKSIEESKSLKDHYNLHEIDIIIKDTLSDHIDMDFVMKYISTRVPSYLLRGIDIIYVGQFDFLINKQANALYEDGAIYITNDQSTTQTWLMILFMKSLTLLKITGLI